MRVRRGFEVAGDKVGVVGHREGMHLGGHGGEFGFEAGDACLDCPIMLGMKGEVRFDQGGDRLAPVCLL
jgi:hypothetical protein